MTPPVCPYCGQLSKLVTGAVIYPRRPDLAHLNFWQCRPCDAFVGCHKAGNGYGDGTWPLGRLADANLRRAKSLAHAAFDRLWKDGGPMTRREAYAWLAKTMNKPPAEAHIGMFDAPECFKVVHAATAKREAMRVPDADPALGGSVYDPY